MQTRWPHPQCTYIGIKEKTNHYTGHALPARTEDSGNNISSKIERPYEKGNAARNNKSLSRDFMRSHQSNCKRNKH
eukprot:scaffold195052_cov23-Prasinocladus_malaysianus.AAC.1